jgi:ABC-type hemin transport system ATPase subunit
VGGFEGSSHERAEPWPVDVLSRLLSAAQLPRRQHKVVPAAANAERNVAVLAALHDLTLAARFGHCIIMMNKGRVQAQGSWRNVLTSANVQATLD